MRYEKDGFSWMDDERLEELIQPERIEEIKKTHLAARSNANGAKSAYLVDVLSESEGQGCTVCFI
jgi:hypothetical protein